MSRGINNDQEQQLFEFDSFETSPTGQSDNTETANIQPIVLDDPQIAALYKAGKASSSISLPEGLVASMSDQMSELSMVEDALDGRGKGKSVSRPVPIRTQGACDNIQGNISSMSPLSQFSSSSASYSYTTGFSSPVSMSSFDYQSLQTPIDEPVWGTFVRGEDEVDLDEDPVIGDELPSISLGKGKGREIAPVLPPLQFEPAAFDYAQTQWSPAPTTPIAMAGPSSFKSSSDLLSDPTTPPIASGATSPSVLQTLASEDGAVSSEHRVPVRPKSLSNLSLRSARSSTVQPLSKIRVKLGSGKNPSNLARKLLFRRRDGAATPPSTPTGEGEPPSPGVRHNVDDMAVLNGVGCFTPPWRTFRHPATADESYFDLSISSKVAQPIPVFEHAQVQLKAAGRAYTEPACVLGVDETPVVTPDVTEPVPEPPLPDLFDEILPRELKLRIFATVVAVHHSEHEQRIANGSWSVRQASSSKNKWVGADRGVRELIKLRRVSKSWQDLAFDGQLWANLNLHPFPRLPSAVVARISSSAGPFVRSLDLSGHGRLHHSALLQMTDDFCPRLRAPGDYMCYTQLTSLNLQGCASLNTRSLHHILIRSPALREVCLRGLRAAGNHTLNVLAIYCSKLTSIDLSRCENVCGDGVRAWAETTLQISKEEAFVPSLKVLRLSGLRDFDDRVMAALAKAAPYLEVLDLSYIRSLHNSAIEAFVSCAEDSDLESVSLTSRQAGRHLNDGTMYHRRVTRLRHICLSSCTLLTDMACANLAHAVPNLEYLELAGIGAALKDEGLVHLLNTTPLIRRIDLEDSSDITDIVLKALTPVTAAPSSASKEPPGIQPGQYLEQLVISYAGNLTDGALVALIKGCPHLRVLEADNTAISGSLLKEFVRTMRKRRTADAQFAAIDCRSVGENIVRDLTPSTRPRLGWRDYTARKLGFLDGRDKEELKVGQDECDPHRVVLKSFYSWQTVDAVRAARDKRRKANERRSANCSGDSVSDDEDENRVRASGGRVRWWSPTGRRSHSGATPPTMNFDDRDACIIM